MTANHKVGLASSPSDRAEVAGEHGSRRAPRPVLRSFFVLDADDDAGEQARIAVCTLQTFSFVLDKIDGFGRRNHAVIIDEAHSSQTGEAARDLKAELGAGDAPRALAQAPR